MANGLRPYNASIGGRAGLHLLFSTRPSLCPVPMPQGVSYVHYACLYIRNIIPDDMAVPSPASLALSGGRRWIRVPLACEHDPRCEISGIWKSVASSHCMRTDERALHKR
jgi:hypothetical protein